MTSRSRCLLRYLKMTIMTIMSVIRSEVGHEHANVDCGRRESKVQRSDR